MAKKKYHTEEDRRAAILRSRKKYNASEKKKALQKRYYEKNKEKLAEKRLKWQRENPEKIAEYNKRKTSDRVKTGKDRAHRQWIKDNFPEKLKAKDAANNALRSGKLERKYECESCGKEGLLHKHHHDYSKPLEVTWLCPMCHKEAHRNEMA